MCVHCWWYVCRYWCNVPVCSWYYFILLHFILFYFTIFVTSCRYRCYGAWGYLFIFKFWDAIQNFIWNMWQVVFANILVQGRVVHSYIYSFFYSSSHIVSLPSYNFEVVYCCFVASSALVFKYRWRCFQMFFGSFSKGSRWLPYILIFTLNLVTLEPAYDITFLGNSVLIFWWYQDIFQGLSSFEMYLFSIFLQIDL